MSDVFDSPDLPPRTFVEFMLKKHEHYTFKDCVKRGIYYPCTECEGSGKVRDPDDRDPVEGYKMAPWYTCNLCKGTGEGKEEEYWDEYKELIEDNKAELARLKKDNATLNSILKKLNPEEIALIYRVTGEDLTKVRKSGV